MPNPTFTSPTVRRQRRKDARPAELLAAALDLFVEKGYAATKVEEVAQRAGVSKGTLFLYYPSKEDLFKAVVRENISQRFVELSALWRNFQGSSTDMIRLGLHGWWLRIGSTKASGIAKLMIAEENNFPELAVFFRQEVIDPIHSLLERIVQNGINNGEFNPVPLERGVHLILAPMLYLVICQHSTITFAGHRDLQHAEAFLNAHIDNILTTLCKSD
jgi:TetR/AcrR family transcriptional regulator